MIEAGRTLQRWIDSKNPVECVIGGEEAGIRFRITGHLRRDDDGDYIVECADGSVAVLPMPWLAASKPDGRGVRFVFDAFEAVIREVGDVDSA